MVEQADSAVEVVLKDKKTFMTKTGIIQTEYTFTILENYNLSYSVLDGEDLKITMIGGTFEGVTSYIDGAPEFKLQEKSFLLLKKIESKLYLSNFSLGKFNIQLKDGEVFYSSSVFPNDEALGKIKKEYMIELIRKKFKSTSQRSIQQNAVVSNTFKNKFDIRKPAQEILSEQSIEEDASRGTGSMWFFFFLMLFSSIFIWWQLKKGVNN